MTKLVVTYVGIRAPGMVIDGIWMTFQCCWQSGWFIKKLHGPSYAQIHPYNISQVHVYIYALGMSMYNEGSCCSSWPFGFQRVPINSLHSVMLKCQTRIMVCIRLKHRRNLIYISDNFLSHVLILNKLLST